MPIGKIEVTFPIVERKIVLAGEADSLRAEKNASLEGIFEEIAG